MGICFFVFGRFKKGLRGFDPSPISARQCCTEIFLYLVDVKVDLNPERLLQKAHKEASQLQKAPKIPRSCTYSQGGFAVAWTRPFGSPFGFAVSWSLGDLCPKWFHFGLRFGSKEEEPQGGRLEDQRAVLSLFSVLPSVWVGKTH